MSADLKAQLERAKLDAAKVAELRADVARLTSELDAATAPGDPSAPRERWVRLSTSHGPAAVEVLETQGGRVLSRREAWELNVRYVAIPRAIDILTGDT